MYNPEEKRKEILISAMKVFEKDGYHKAKVEDIAIEAGVGKGTIYEYFDSKKNLFEEIIHFCINEYFHETDKLFKEEKDVLSKLKKYILLEIQTTKKFGNIANIFINEGNQIDVKINKALIEARDKKIHQLVEIFTEGIQKGIFKEVNTYMAALLFAGGINQIIIDKFVLNQGPSNSHPSLNETSTDLEAFLNIFLHGIKLS